MGRKNTENKFLLATETLDKKREEQRIQQSEKAVTSDIREIASTEAPVIPGAAVEKSATATSVQSLPANDENQEKVLQAVNHLFKSYAPKGQDARISVYLDSAQKEAFAAKCKKYGRKMNDVINELIDFYIKNC